MQFGPSASPEPYLWDVDSLAFDYFDRDDIAITQADQVPSRAVSVQVTVRGRGIAYSESHAQLLTGRVTLRNGG